MAVKLRMEQAKRAGGLLPMLYRPAELAEEIGCSRDTVYDYVRDHGAPCEKDSSGHLWIPGHLFREWARANVELSRDRQKSRLAEKMPEGMAFCFRCRKRTLMNPVEVRMVNRYLEIVVGTCAECDGNVNRAQKRGGDGQS